MENRVGGGHREIEEDKYRRHDQFYSCLDTKALPSNITCRVEQSENCANTTHI